MKGNLLNEGKQNQKTIKQQGDLYIVPDKKQSSRKKHKKDIDYGTTYPPLLGCFDPKTS